MWMSVGLRIDDLIASLQRLRLPRGLVITIAVVFRYLPTAADEFRKISATMRLRGVELSARNLVLHPGRSLEYVLVPLIIRTIKISRTHLADFRPIRHRRRPSTSWVRARRTATCASERRGALVTARCSSVRRPVMSRGRERA